MFRETLLESAPSGRKRKRWPMAMAFTAELVVAGLLVMLPLLSTGVISVSAHVPLVAPLRSVDILDHSTTAPPIGCNCGRGLARPVVIIASNRDAIHLGFPPPNTEGQDIDGPPYLGPTEKLPDGIAGGTGTDRAAAQPRLQRVRLSTMSEGQLVNRVEPVYPKIAMLTGTQGAVKLHAIIAKDGSIESLTVTSGHPLLAHAAVDAVKQWRYRPYYLNGEPVEVETFITVNFKKTND